MGFQNPVPVRQIAGGIIGCGHCPACERFQRGQKSVIMGIRACTAAQQINAAFGFHQSADFLPEILHVGILLQRCGSHPFPGAQIQTVCAAMRGKRDGIGLFSVQSRLHHGRKLIQGKILRIITHHKHVVFCGSGQIIAIRNIRRQDQHMNRFCSRTSSICHQERRRI